jgi:hypothetical protein
MNKKDFLIFTGVGDNEDHYQSWALNKSEVFDRALFYYGENEERYTKILSNNTEHCFKKPGMIWSNFVHNYINFSNYSYVLVVDSDLRLNPKDLELTFQLAKENNWTACQWSRDEKSFGLFVNLFKQDISKKYRKTNFIEMIFLMLRKDVCADLVLEYKKLELVYSTGVDLLLANLALEKNYLPFYVVDEYKFYNPHPREKINSREIDTVTKTHGGIRMKKLIDHFSKNQSKYKIRNASHFECDNKKFKYQDQSTLLWQL